jgi:Flp pilus assembly protein CpaB
MLMTRQSSTATVPRPPVSSNGQTPIGVSVTSPSKRRPAWVLLGAAAVVLAMLVGAWVFASSNRTVSVLVAGKDIGPGQVLTAGDVRVLTLAHTNGLRAVQPGEQALIVGRAARGPIPSGTVLNTGLFAEPGRVVPTGQIVVGAALDPGAAPSSRLAAGDRVEVLAVARSTAGSPGASGSPVVVATGSVWSVEPIGSGASSTGKLWVSLLVPESTHGEVAQAAADGRLRLGLLGAGG